MLDEALYGDCRGGTGPVLLMAAGQRIDTALQLRRLKDAGYSVEMPSMYPRQTVTASDAARAGFGPEDGPHREFSSRLRQAIETREALVSTAKSLFRRVQEGALPDMGAIEDATGKLACEVASDPQAHTALTYLLRCDDYTVEHSTDVAVLMAALTSILGLSEEEQRLASLAGLLHDVGKQGIPEEILTKPGALTKREYDCIKTHPSLGLEVLSGWDRCPEAVRQVVYQHHERLDGSGYQQGLKGDGIHRFARIAGVVDSFDAMSARRVYSIGVPPRLALREIYSHRDVLFDSEPVLALVKLIGVYPVGTRVLLSTGESGVVSAPNMEDTTRPWVLVDKDRRGRSLDPPFLLVWRAGDPRIVGTSAEGA
ncbi:MAG TPA: HD-GYP domain-containing protein [Armatimonadota bacterium]